MFSRRVFADAILLASALTLASTAALADSVQRRTPKDYAQFSWTGHYVGAHGGYGWADDAAASISPANAATAQFVGPVIAIGAIPANYSVDPDGFLGGVQAGYNLQFGSLVVGAEADISWMDMGESQTLAPTPVILNRFATDIDWVSTIRGRFGVLASPTLLIYGTGGFAFADIDQTIHVSAVNGDAFAGSNSGTVNGWTIGGGLEWVLSRNWTLKGEYLFVELDPDNFSTGAAGGSCSNVTNNCVLNVTTGDIELHTLRAGINYKF